MQKNSKNIQKTANDMHNRDKKWRRITVVSLLVILLFILLVIGHFVYKHFKHEKSGEYTVSLVQPASDWTLKVNDQKDNIKVKESENLYITIESSSNEFTSFEMTNDSAMYYVQVVKTSDQEKTPLFKNELILVDSNKYTTNFPMVWNFDITISIVSSLNYDESYYSLTTDGSQVDYVFEKSTIFNYNLDYITVINVMTYASTNVKKTEFGKVVDKNDEDLVKNIHIGKEIKEIYSGFLYGCTSFNKPIIFDEGSSLETIDVCFMYQCEKFDQEIKLPSKLINIENYFMCKCSSFNNGNATELVLDNLILNGSGFLAYDTSFNKPITFGSKLTTIPSYFLLNCTNFNQDVLIPISIEKIGNGFLEICDNMTSTITVNCNKTAFTDLTGSADFCSTDNAEAKCYKQGIQISGTNKDEWKAAFPNLPLPEAPNYYRNLI